MSAVHVLTRYGKRQLDLFTGIWRFDLEDIVNGEYRFSYAVHKKLILNEEQVYELVVIAVERYHLDEPYVPSVYFDEQWEQQSPPEDHR